MPTAAAFIDRIPVAAVKKTAQMQNLLANFLAPEVVRRFADEDFTMWPFWKRGDGLLARGKAYFIVKEGEKAESDLGAALEWIGASEFAIPLTSRPDQSRGKITSRSGIFIDFRTKKLTDLVGPIIEGRRARFRIRLLADCLGDEESLAARLEIDRHAGARSRYGRER